MQTYYDCYPCILRQAIEAARMTGATPEQTRALVLQTLETLKQIPDGSTPPEISACVHELVRGLVGCDDPYLSVKIEATEKALNMVPELQQRIEESEDPFSTALRISLAGNIMDFGPNPDYNLREVVMRVLNQTPALDETDALRESLNRVDWVLFIGDNAGEIVFDRLFIEKIPCPVVYAVRGGPVINDATLEDAILAGIDSVAVLIDTGARIPGVVLSKSGRAFQEKFKAAPLIIAKGMGNYETLSDVSAPIYFLFQVKCPVVGKDVGADVQDIIISRRA